MPRELAAREGETADVPGFGTRFLLTGASTGGNFALVEHTIAARTLAAPTHTHATEDEYGYVLAGRVGAQVGEEEIEAGPGEVIAKPRQVPHAFWNPGDEEARLLELISPAGFEQYFARLAPLLAGGGPPDLEALGALQAEYSMTMDPASIGTLIERHGLRPPG